MGRIPPSAPSSRSGDDGIGGGSSEQLADAAERLRRLSPRAGRAWYKRDLSFSLPLLCSMGSHKAFRSILPPTFSSPSQLHHSLSKMVSFTAIFATVAAAASVAVASPVARSNSGQATFFYQNGNPGACGNSAKVVALVAGYQFCITIGLLLAACVNYGVKEYQNSAEYRVPIGLQFIFGLVLGGGLLFLPDSPRYYVKRGRVEKARKALSSVRGQPQDSEYVEAELAGIIANEECERSLIPAGSWINGWMNCFRGSVFKSNSNLRKTILGTSLQMMQQWTGVNFIFYYSTPFLSSTGAI